VLEVGSSPQVPTFRNSTYLDPQVGLTKNLGARQKDNFFSKKYRFNQEKIKFLPTCKSLAMKI
jgi:hypothetical protein